MPVAFDHPDWIFENKYDGFRSLAFIEGGSVGLVSRKGNVYKTFAGLCSGIRDAINCRDAVLDGEIVHLDSAGKPQFYSLLHRRMPQTFIAFDVLWRNGKDLRPLPLLERKRILRSLVPAASPHVIYAEHIDTTGTRLFRAVCEGDLEGIVGKLKCGLYTPGETTWVKTRNPRYSQGEGRRELFQRRAATA